MHFRIDEDLIYLCSIDLLYYLIYNLQKSLIYQIEETPFLETKINCDTISFDTGFVRNVIFHCRPRKSVMLECNAMSRYTIFEYNI